jgi:hypothetical protein
VYGPADGLHGLAEVGPCDIFCFFSVFSPFLTLYYWIYFYIFLFLHITKASPCLTPYRLKGKKGVGRLRTPYRLKNYGRNDGDPSLLGNPLLRKRELHLERDCNNESIQRPSILIVIDVAVPNCFPHVLHLEPYPHHCGPLDVVGLGEGRPPAAGTDVPDNGLDPMVTMVPVREGESRRL